MTHVGVVRSLSRLICFELGHSCFVGDVLRSFCAIYFVVEAASFVGSSSFVVMMNMEALVDLSVVVVASVALGTWCPGSERGPGARGCCNSSTT